MAPELKMPAVITLKADIYSLGVVITEILTGRMAYSTVKNVRAIKVYVTIPDEGSTHINNYVMC